MIDDAQVYNRVLSGSEIAALAGNTGLQMSLALDEGTGTTVADTSGNGNTGTVTRSDTGDVIEDSE